MRGGKARDVGEGRRVIGKITKKLFGQTEHSPGSTAEVAVFGKHPGWADHMEELGMTTESLVWIRQRLYSEGIGGNIDKGTWEHLADEERLEGFDHEFLGQSESGAWVGGRFWSSSDGRGRTKYPMFACVQCPGPKRSWLMFTALPELAMAQARFASASTADEVRQATNELRARMQSSMSVAEPADFPSHGEAMRRLLDAGLGDPAETILRTVYGFERELGLLLGRVTAGSQSQVTAAFRSGSVRVPRGSGGVAEGLWRWAAVLEPVLPKRRPMLLIAPAGHDWVDVVVGESSTEDFSGIRTHSAALPRISEIPYTVDESVRERLAGLVS